MSSSLRQQQPGGAGRKNGSVVFAFALSLLLHASILLLLTRDAAKDAPLALGFNLQPTPLSVRLIPAPATPAAKPRSELVRVQVTAAQSSPSPTASHPDEAKNFVKSPLSATPKFVDLKTGDQLNVSHWRGVKRQGRPIKIRLTINPAGLIANWETLSPGAGPLQLDLEAMNHMVRNMDANRTGETHVVIWESQVGKKNGELIARMYLSSDD